MKNTVILLQSAAVSLAFASAAASDPIATFMSLCLPNLNDPAAIHNAGETAGFQMTSLGNNSFMGFRKATDESLQINAFTQHAFECAVTTSDVADPEAFRDAFFAPLGLSHRQGEAQGAVKGQTFTFKHDTNGGEALVVYAN